VSNLANLSRTDFAYITCPVHESKQQKCSTWYDGRGRLRARCWTAGCDEDAILAALGEPLIRRATANSVRSTAVQKQYQKQRADKLEKSLRNRIVDINADGGMSMKARRSPKPEYRAELLARPFSLELLAEAKRLPLEFLKRECRLRQGGGFTHKPVVILYFSLSNRHLFDRRRLALKGDRFRQPLGVSLAPYGLWRLRRDLERTRGELFICEGESDCWTFWFLNHAALGLPGASNAKLLQRKHLYGVRNLIVWQEPGDAGARFAETVVERLRYLRSNANVD
jgi:hypothetical protein